MTRVYPRGCGGTTPLPVSSSRRVYPRGCGGTTSTPDMALRRVYPRGCGGTFRGRSVAKLNLGSIPAGAGEPTQSTRLASRSPVGLSPRVRGNPNSTLTQRPLNAGLSPRVRGNRLVAACPLTVRGLSPRVRGNQPIAQSQAFKGLSPRVRGNRGTPGETLAGLSPRVRGNLKRDPICLCGSIPAGAGEPYVTA